MPECSSVQSVEDGEIDLAVDLIVVELAHGFRIRAVDTGDKIFPLLHRSQEIGDMPVDVGDAEALVDFGDGGDIVDTKLLGLGPQIVRRLHQLDPCGGEIVEDALLLGR